MCMMTVKYGGNQDDEIVMENVVHIKPSSSGITLKGLLDGEQELVGFEIEEIDFSSGQTRLRKMDA